MRKFEYRPPRIHSGELRTRVTFFEFAPNDGPIPGEKKEKILYETWAKVDEVWTKDIELAKANGTLSDLTIHIRDTHGEYTPTNKHYIKIHAPEYEDLNYNIKQVMPDLQYRDFIKIVAGVST